MNLQRFAQERTEAASDRRREQARGRGQVARSPDVATALTLLGVSATVGLMGSAAVASLAGFLHGHLGSLARWVGPISDADLAALLLDGTVLAAAVVAPPAAAALVTGVLANLVQVGFLFTLHPLTPSLGRLNPVEGLKRLVSRRALAALGKAVLKVVVVGYVAYKAVVGEVVRLSSLGHLSVAEAAALVGRMAVTVLLRVALLLLALAVLDYLYQRWEHGVSLRMTRQEVKDEHKQTEGSPELRARVRQRQREMARQRMIHDVRKADVVVTNPTHVAVALVYDGGRMAAPQVLAKGQGYVALRIREEAERHGVPLVENPPLARALAAAVAVGQTVPSEMYQAVAEVLAFVYRLRGRV